MSSIKWDLKALFIKIFFLVGDAPFLHSPCSNNKVPSPYWPTSLWGFKVSETVIYLIKDMYEIKELNGSISHWGQQSSILMQKTTWDRWQRKEDKINKTNFAKWSYTHLWCTGNRDKKRRRMHIWLLVGEFTIHIFLKLWQVSFSILYFHLHQFYLFLCFKSFRVQVIILLF